MSHKVSAAVFLVSVLLMTSCGGGGSSDISRTTNPNTSTKAQGIYSGTIQANMPFEAIVLPGDRVSVLHGATSTDPHVFLVDGLMAGQGTSNSGSYTATVTDYFGSNPVSGTLTATYVPGASFTGTIVAGGTTIPFSGTAIPSFNFDTAASLSTLTGTWIGTLMYYGDASITVDANGNLSGTSQGCSFSGTLKPDTSGKNFFTFSVSFGLSPCSPPLQSANGIAVTYLLSDGVTRQLAAVGTSGTFGTALVAHR